MTFIVDPNWTWNELQSAAEDYIKKLEKTLEQYKEWTVLKRSQDSLYMDTLNALMESHDRKMEKTLDALKTYHRAYLLEEGRTMQEAYEKAKPIIEGLK